MTQSEKTTEAFLFKQMRLIGGVAAKYVCPNHNGKPDRICEFPYGLTAFIEVKSEGKKPEPHQLREHRRMKKRGQIVEVVDTKAKVMNFIELYGRIDNELQLCKRVEEHRNLVGKSILRRTKIS
jgi:hypothetical protein